MSWGWNVRTENYVSAGNRNCLYAFTGGRGLPFVTPMRRPMVNPLEIMPILALAAMIVFIPLLGERTELPVRARKVSARK